MTSPKQTTKQHSTLVGARFAALTVTDRMIVSCPDIERLTVLNLSAAADVAGTVLLDDIPGAVLYSSSKVWTVTKDGYLLKLSNADTPVLQATINIRASRSDWITSCNTIIIAPGPVGSLVSLNSSGEILDQIDGVLSRVTMALGLSDGYLYAFDSDGNGAVVLVDTTTGLMTKIADFEATDCQGILQGFVDSEFVVLAIGELDRVVVFDVSADRLDPVISESTIYDGYTLNGVLNDYDLNPDFSPLTEEFRSGLGITEWWPVVLGKFLGYQDVIFLHPDSGRVTMLLNEAPVVSAGIDQSVSLGNSVQLAGVVSDDGFPDFDSLSHQWTKVSGPGTVSFDADNALNAIATIGTAGVYVLRLTASDGQHSASDTVTITVTVSIAASFASVSANSLVTAMAYDAANNLLYIGGLFSSVSDANGAHVRTKLACLNVTTGLFTSWAPTASDTVWALMVHSSGNIYVGGQFTQLNSTARQFLGVIDTAGVLVSGFADPVIAGGSGLVQTILEFNSLIYVAGGFATVNGVSYTNAACFNTSGVVQSGWKPQPVSACRSLAGLGANVYIGGQYSTINGATRKGVSSVDKDTAVSTAFDGNIGGSSFDVYSINIASGIVYVDGHMATAGPGPTARLGGAAILAADNSLNAYDPHFSAGATVIKTKLVGSTLYSSGSFTTVNSGTARVNFCATDLTGTLTSLRCDLNGSAFCMDVSSGLNAAFVGGSFSQVGANGPSGAQTRTNIAVINTITGAVL